jgi:hypothetical protein
MLDLVSFANYPHEALTIVLAVIMIASAEVA